MLLPLFCVVDGKPHTFAGYVGWCYCHGGRCYNHPGCVCYLADVKSQLWLMELPQVSIYFKFSSEMLSRTSSHICGRWYLPMFLFRDGLFTLMYRASLMVLMRFWSSLPSMEKLSIVTVWPEMLRWSCIGEGAFMIESGKSLSCNKIIILF